MSARIVMHFEDAAVTLELVEGAASRALLARLPLVLRMTCGGIGVCGQLSFELPHDAASVHAGWRDGDVNYSPAGGWLALFFDDEENSARYGSQLTLGRIEGPLDVVRSLSGIFDVLIERA